jgi:hypothetical protein
VGAGATAQSAQASSTSGRLVFLSTGAAVQPRHQASGLATLRFVGLVASSQLRQVATGSAEVTSIAPAPEEPVVTGRAPRAAVTYGRMPILTAPMVDRRAHGSTLQARQAASGRARVRQRPTSIAMRRDEWLVLDLELAA